MTVDPRLPVAERTMSIWQALEAHINKDGIEVDRPKDSAHPRFPDRIYPLGYGYIRGTSAADGGGIDVFVGSLHQHKVTGMLATFDDAKGDAEIKVLYDCTPEEAELATNWLGQMMMVIALPVDNTASTSDAPTDGDIELWDILNTAGLPTGRVVARNTGGGDPEANLLPGEVHRIVVVCVFGEDGRMLIQQRTWMKIGWPGLWDLSAGGSALAGETSQQAASRELAEEVGINVDFTGQRPHISLTRPGVLLDIFLTDLPDIDPATLVLQADEVQTVRWSNQREILAMIGQGTFCPFHESLIDLIYDVRRRPGELAH